LLHAGLCSSHVGLWTVEHEDCADNIIHNVIKMFNVVLALDKSGKEHPEGGFTGSGHHRSGSTQRSGGGLARTLALFKRVLNLSCMDTAGGKLIVSLAYKTHRINLQQFYLL